MTMAIPTKHTQMKSIQRKSIEMRKTQGREIIKGVEGEKRAGYYSKVFEGQRRLRSVDSSPSAVATVASPLVEEAC